MALPIETGTTSKAGSGSQELDNKAQVLVSTDGESFTAFPGFIGPGGACFDKDLSTIGFTEARFVKIVDSGECCLSGNPEGGGDGWQVEFIEALNSAQTGQRTLPLRLQKILCQLRNR